MAKNNPVVKDNPEEEIEISEKDLEELEEFESHLLKEVPPPIPVSAEVRKSLGELKEIELERQKTFGVLDKDLKKPLRQTELLPEGMHVISGNDEGSVEGTFNGASYYAVTEKGIDKVNKSLRNERNDDAFLIDPQRGIFMVSDGLGGYAAGHVASNISVYQTAKNLEKTEDINKLSLRRTIKDLDKDVRKFQNNNQSDCKSTAAAVMIARQKKNRVIEVAYAGDTRFMLIRNNKVVEKTRDHNFLSAYKLSYKLPDDEGIIFNHILNKIMEEARLKGKELNENEALEQAHDKLKEYKQQVVQTVGGAYCYDLDELKTKENTVAPEKSTFKAEKGDIAFMCSDGVTDNLSDEEIAQALYDELLKGRSLGKAVATLKIKVLNKMRQKDGKGDNIVILAWFVE